ncbi:hypothetical protein IV102_00045 [bacterium]|nr:hypothetical protein [bacterium]
MESDLIRQRLQGLDFASRLPRLEELQKEMRDLDSQVMQTSRRVSTLDKLNIFSDSPEEVQVKRLKQAIEVCQGEYAGIAGQWNQTLADLEKEFPDFAQVRGLERLLSQCIDFVGGTAGNPVLAVAQLKEQLLQPHSLVELLQGLSDVQSCQHHRSASHHSILGPLARSLPADYPGWKVQEDPLQLTAPLTVLCYHLAQLPSLRCALALAQLEAVLKQSRPVDGRLLQEDGSLLSQPILPLGACIVECLENVVQAAGESWPGVPFGQQVQGWFLPADTQPPPPPEAPLWQQFRDEVNRRTLAVVALDSLLSQASSQVSWSDRVNVFTQSASEAREQVLKAALTRAQEQLDQTVPNQEADAHSLAGMVASHCLNILRASHRVSTQEGTSSSKINCKLNHQRPLAEAVEGFRSWLRDRNQLPFTLRQLIDQVEQAPAGEGNTPAQWMRARLANQPFAAMLGEARQKRQAALAAFQRRSQSCSEVSVLDRLNVFTESASEKAAKQSKGDWRAAEAAARSSEEHLEAALFGALREFPEAHLYYASEELSVEVPALQAVCRSKTRSHGHGDDKHRHATYYCEVSGLASVQRLTRDLISLAASCGCRGGETWTQMTRRASRVSHPVLRSLLPNWFSAGLQPGQVRLDSSHASFSGSEFFEDMYLAWCQANGLGPASPGRF